MSMLFILSSPSGCGKTTLCRALLEKFKDLEESISVTTRNMRQGEKNGIDYYFVTKDDYQNMLNNGEFLENAEFCGNLYGTLKSEVTRISNANKNAVLFDIEWKGASQIKNNKNFDIVTVFILPPSIKHLKNRLLSRNSDSIEIINQRLNTAKNDISHANEYDYIIINDDLDRAKEEICSIYNAERLKRKRNENVKIAENMQSENLN